ncbi:MULTISPECIES: hypothetical protein [Aequorivita]|uniref:DUF4296 domain-containing protein n=1 Tax=Aequorivita iocasae TaxID=2803865 RepID=A0ABX7DTL3_9FLAO|nr:MULTISPECIES: hypothetical protein [Aequorivita]QQX77414.1 hypothetical protein JK629_03840 [Aequorivita iocasae]UCA56904.1 hypothetical protein LDL78_03860 [Aequorivita sp. F7]
MKPLRTLLIATFSIALFSCGNTQTATTSVENTPDTKGTIREVADPDDNRWNRNSDQTTSSTNAPTPTSTDWTMNKSNTTSADMNSNKKASQQSTMTSTAPRKLNDNEIEVYWIGLKKVDMTSMYDYVNMSEDQVLKYQRGYADYIDSMQNKDMRLTIDQKDLLKQRDGILYDILKPAQYEKYKEWKKMNPNYGM